MTAEGRPFDDACARVTAMVLLTTLSATLGAGAAAACRSALGVARSGALLRCEDALSYGEKQLQAGDAAGAEQSFSGVPCTLDGLRARLAVAAAVRSALRSRALEGAARAQLFVPKRMGRRKGVGGGRSCGGGQGRQ